MSNAVLVEPIRQADSLPDLWMRLGLTARDVVHQLAQHMEMDLTML